MNKLVFFSIVALFLFGSCNYSKDLKVVKFNDGTKAKYHLDSNGDIQGTFISYYPEGSIKSKMNYENNLKDGIEIGYFPSGKISYKSSWLNNNRVGDYFEYSKEGILLIHKFYSLEGFLFLKEYDLRGNLIKEVGKNPLWIVFNKKDFNVNDSIEVIVFVTSSNDYKCDYTIQECVDGSCKSILEQEVVNDIPKNILAKKSIFTTTAKTKEPFEWIIEFKMNNVIMNIDTVKFNRG